jgi:hypothetical protein
LILLVSHGGDQHLPRVATWLEQIRAPWALLDTDDYPQHMTIADGPHECRLQIKGRTLTLSEITAVWWRRPRPPVIGGRPDGIVAWAQQQAFIALDSALRGIDAVWVNHPTRNRHAEDKPANLRRAVAAGLDVPDWLVTNDAVQARAFANATGQVVVKPVASAYVPLRGNLWTRRVDDFGWLERIGPEPYLLQHFIDKTHDIRVVVVGDELFAVAIDSQATAETSVDLRAGGALRDLPHRQVDLPPWVRDALLGLCASLHLRFAAIDLVVDHDGHHWFLELNPNGQWAWLEEAAGVQITKALVRQLSG